MKKKYHPEKTEFSGSCEGILEYAGWILSANETSIEEHLKGHLRRDSSFLYYIFTYSGKFNY
jgi:hypothetical protein